MKNKLKNMYKRAKKVKNITLMKKARDFEKKIRAEVTKNMRNKIRTEANLGQKNLWKAVSIAQGRQNHEIPDMKMDGDTEAKTDEEKVEAFAEHFEKKIQKLSNESWLDRDVYDGKRKIFGKYRNDWVTEELVTEVLKNTKHKRCQGYDRIPLCFYVDGYEILAKPITILMQKVIHGDTIPEQWKIAKLIPLHKKGKRNLLANYRPISNLCSITKIYEKLILNYINYIEKQENIDLTGEHQHGFKKNHSTETAGLEIQSTIARECDMGKYAAISSIDLSAAFDVIDHKKLIHRLKILGLPGQLVSTIENWLSDRSFYCELQGKASFLRRIRCGTIQGSILGPLLFALYTLPLAEVAENLFTYADDNYQIGSAETEQEAIQRCITQTEITAKWMKDSGLVINNEKTEVCVFHKQDTNITEVMLNGSLITIKKSIKILGIIFDSKLNWFEHVDNAIDKANRAKQALGQIAKYFEKEELLKLATAYFYSRLYYGAKIWLMTTLASTLILKLWQTSSRMLRIVDNNRVRPLSYANLHKKYKRATPSMWCQYTTALAMREVVCNNIPLTCVPFVAINQLHNDRAKGMKFTRTNKLKIGFNCLSNRLQCVSKLVEIDCQNVSKETFKKYCKQLLINDALQKLR